MNVIYHGFNDSFGAEVIKKLHERKGWNPVHISANFVASDSSKLNYMSDKCIIANTADIRRSQFDYKLLGNPVPIDHSIIEDISPYTTNYLGMLGGFDPTGHKFGFDDRKKYFYDVLEYWNTVIVKKTPRLIVFITWPHTPSCYALYLIAKYHFKIDVLYVDPTPLFDKQYYLIRTSLEKNDFFCERDNTEDRHALDDGISRDISSYIESMRETVQSKTPYHIEGDFLRFEHGDIYYKWFLSFLRVVANRIVNKEKLYSDVKANTKPYYLLESRMTAVQRSLFSRRMTLNNRRLIKYYSKYTSSVNFNKRYIYFPAPYQPEATTIVGAGYFEEIFLVLDMLSSSCPKDYIIYYKEHPATFFDKFKGSLKRGSHFYKKLNSYKNIIMVPMDLNNFELIDNSVAVVSMAGSSGWESVLRGKPAILFGNTWYSRCPGVIDVKNLKDLKNAFYGIENGYKVNVEDVEDYCIDVAKEVVVLDGHYTKFDNVAKHKKNIELLVDGFFVAYNKYYN